MSAQTCLFTNNTQGYKNILVFIHFTIMNSEDSSDSEYYEDLEDSVSDSSEYKTSSVSSYGDDNDDNMYYISLY